MASEATCMASEATCMAFTALLDNHVKSVCK